MEDQLDQTATEFKNYRKTYRDLTKMNVRMNGDVISSSVLEKNVHRQKNEMLLLNSCIIKIDNQYTRAKNIELIRKMSLILAEDDHRSEEIQNVKSETDLLKCQIKRVNRELSKFPRNDRYPSHKLVTIESKLFHTNQEVNSLKKKAQCIKELMNDLMIIRQRFQSSRNKIIIKLLDGKLEIFERVNHYTLAFSNGMQNCRDIELLQQQIKDNISKDLQEIEQLKRMTQANSLLTNFVITKTMPNQWQSKALPNRDVLVRNYVKSSEEFSEILRQINEHVPVVTPDLLKENRRDIFSNYLYSNELQKSIDDSKIMLSTMNEGCKRADNQINTREDEHIELQVLEDKLCMEAAQMQSANEYLTENEAKLTKIYEKITHLYTMLECDKNSKLHQANINQLNVDEILRNVEKRLRNIQHTVFCWQRSQGKQFVHGIEFERSPTLPKVSIVPPCSECSPKFNICSPKCPRSKSLLLK